MKVSRLLAAVGTATCVFTSTSSAQTPVVISQVYGGSAVTGATYNRDFVELRNRTALPFDLAGYSIQYASATGSTWQKVDLSGTIPANGYFLVQMTTTGTSGGALPTPDLIAATAVNMATAQGKVALVNNTTLITGTACPITGGFGVVDFVGYGVAGVSNPCFEGAGSTGVALSSTIAAFRNGGGCDDTNNNNADFTNGTPSARNTASPAGPTCNLNQADLSVAASGTPNPAYVGVDTITYTLTVNNLGGGVANNSLLVLPIPAGLTGIASSPVGSIVGPNYEIPLGNIAASGSVPVTITGNPSAEGTISANFAASTTSAESTTSNNSASVAIAALNSSATTPLKISQVYPGGGSSNAAAAFQRDYVELYNAGASPISLNGRSLQYQAATGTTWTRFALPNVTVDPGQYYLIGVGTTGTGGAPLPAIDATTTSFSLSATGGKVALVNANTNLPSSTCDPSAAVILDYAAWGTANCSETLPAAWVDGDIVRALHRLGDGCTDTFSNLDDYITGLTGPRSTSTTAVCAAPATVNNILDITSAPTLFTAVGTGTLSYSGVVNNIRSVPSTNTVVTVTLPTTATGVTSSPPGTFNGITGQLTIPLGSITGPATFLVNFTPTVEETIVVPVVVTQNETDTATANNSTALTTVIQRQSDLGISVAASPTCQVPASTPAGLTHTFTVTNNGPADITSATATVVFPASLTPVSATTASGTAVIGTTVDWTTGALASGASATLTVVYDVGAVGEHVTTASVSSSVIDPVTTNNSLTRRNTSPLPRPEVLAQVLKTSVTSAPTDKRTVTTVGGGSANLVGSETFGRPYVSPDGSKFVVRMDTDANSAGGDQIVVVTTGASPTYTAISQVGDPVGAGTISGLDVVLAINDAGQVAFSGVRSGLTSTTDDFVARWNPGNTITIIAEEGSLAPGLGGGETIGTTSTVQDLLNNGDVIFTASLSGATTTNAYLGRSDGTTSSSVIRKGVDSPLATPPFLSGTWNVIDGTAIDTINGFDADGSQSINSGTLSVATTNDDTIVVNGSVAVQEGSAISPLGTNVSSILYSYMEGDGAWMAYGSNTGGLDWVVRNGSVIAQTGAPAYTGATENWSDTSPLTPGSGGVYAQTFFQAHGRGSNWVVAGITDVADGWTNGVVASQGAVVIREGDPIDLNGNGIADDNAVINTWRDDRMFIGADGYLYAVVSVRSPNTCGTPTVQDLGQALIRVPLPTAGCNRADITDIGDTGAGPDGQLTVDDIIAFVNTFSDGTGCPGTPPCNRADITDIGDTGSGPDGQLTVDDIIAYINAFGDGCPA